MKKFLQQPVDPLWLIVVCVVRRSLNDIERKAFFFMTHFVVCHDLSRFIMLAHQQPHGALDVHFTNLRNESGKADIQKLFRIFSLACSVLPHIFAMAFCRIPSG